MDHYAGRGIHSSTILRSRLCGSKNINDHQAGSDFQSNYEQPIAAGKVIDPFRIRRRNFVLH